MTSSSPTAARLVVGIDLGTTFSLCATLVDGRPCVVRNALGEHLTPSAVSVLPDGSVIVGAAALARASTHPEATALDFKREMGTDRRYTLAGRQFRPQELSALVLEQLKHDAEAALGRPVDEAVVTVPAYFGDAQRQATRDAAAIAGLKVERIINEPTAAAIAYGLMERHRSARAVVLDLGGGTFDVTVLELTEGIVEISACAGDARLGGRDFDAALADLVARRLVGERGVLVAPGTALHEQLLANAEEAKKQLATEAEAVIGLNLEDGAWTTSVTRAEAGDAFGELLARLNAPILRALGDARLKAADIDEVLLVGGSTRLPWVGELATRVFQRFPQRDLPPDEAVVLGAALQAALKAKDAAVGDLIVTDVAPFTLGTSVVTHLGQMMVSGVFAPIIERGTTIPTSRVERFYAVADRQTEVRIRVFQGEHPMCNQNQFLGEYMVEGLRAQDGEPPAVDVRFTYDLNGLLEVETTVVATDKKKVLLIERAPGTMTKAEVAQAQVAMAKLKRHPRELLPNTTALARAEALYVQMTGPARLALGDHIARFRAALDTQQAQLIDSERETLRAVTQRLSSARS